VLFPNQKMLVYAPLREVVAKKEYTCSFSASIIRVGTIYVPYRPMVKNIDTKETYVLKDTLRVDPYYYTDLPTSIGELDQLSIKILTQPEDGMGIDYSHLCNEVGGSFSFVKLKERKFNGIRYRE